MKIRCISNHVPPSRPRWARDPEEEVFQVEGAEGISLAMETGGQPETADAAWLSRSLLLVVGPADVDPGEARATLVAGDDAFDVAVRCFSVGQGSGFGERRILTVATGADGGSTQAPEKLSVGEGEGANGMIELRLTDLGVILNGQLAGLGQGVARQVIEFISAAPTAHGLSGERDLGLSNNLHLLRDALREELPPAAIERDQALTGNIDAIVPIDDSTFFIRGWIRDGEAQIIRLTAITPEGEWRELLGRLFRFELPELVVFEDGPYSEPVDGTKFVAHFETSSPSRLREAWVFEMENETGRGVEMYALPDVVDIPAARAKILRSVPESALPDERLMADHIFPAIDRLQERARESVEVASIVDYGTPVESPEVSIIVPLYERIDFVEHQLLQFNRDPEVQAEELIYVLDSPELEKALADRARQLARLYRVPFRIVTMAQNVGFGAATNAGASVARGKLLLLLNSDVLPAAPGWLGKLRAFHHSTANIGALGAKLLYEDDSLQHAGLYFDLSQQGPTAGLWANMHYFKGLHKDLPAANVARPVPAVTAACLLIEKDLYHEAGGLPDVYVQGDYEDSELCLRLPEHGRENWYLPAAELYHLEGCSYLQADRGITGSYNRWLHTQRCGQAIEDAMARYARI